jgi:threonine dehydrogenase-like Zn-dependent dehydrogenase
MKSLAVEKDYSLHVVEIPMPKIDDTSVLVRTLASGICGTDTKIMHGTFKDIDQYPCLIGHEAVGEVVEVGKKVTAFRSGDKILLPYIENETNGYSSYWGGFSEYGICRDWKAMAAVGTGPFTKGFNDFHYTQKTIPRDFDPVSSVMIITLREVLAASYHFGFSINDSIIIFGAGSVGLAFAKFAKILGCSPVIIVDICDEKIADAEAVGADYAINSTKVNVSEEIKKICPDGVDYAIDAVGVNALIPQAMEVVRDNGRILVYGISPVLSMNLDWSRNPYNWSIEFFQFPVKEKEGEVHQQILNWIQLGIIDLGDFVSHTFYFSDILKAFEVVEKKLPSKKIVIKY